MRISSFVANVALLCMSILVCVLLCEAGLRLLGLSWPQFYITDQYLGFRRRPYAEGWVKDEGVAYVRNNSAGWRDIEHDLDPAPNTIRIAILGDSFTEAAQVDIEQTYWSVLRRQLASCPAVNGMDIEVMNFGVSSYGTAQEFLALQEYVLPYRPDVVVLGFFAGNDLSNNVRDLEQNPDRPYFTLSGSTLIPDFSFREKAFYVDRQKWRRRTLEAVHTHSRVVQLLWEVRRRWQVRDTKNMHDTAVESGLDSLIYTPPATPLFQEAWDVTEALIAAMYETATQHSAKFVVLNVTTAIQVHPDPEVRQNYAREIGVPNLFYPELRLQELGKETGFPVVPLVEVFGEYAFRTGQPLHGFNDLAYAQGHWNSEGHRIAGEHLADFFCKNFDVLLPNK